MAEQPLPEPRALPHARVGEQHPRGAQPGSVALRINLAEGGKGEEA